MVLSKTTFRAFLCAVGKISGQSSRNHNIMYVTSKQNKFNSSYSKFIVASAAALGFSLYIAHKNKISCDIDLADVKIRNEIQTYEEAISKSRDVLQRIKDEVGAPGIVIGVSINGKTVWKEGLGYSDIENRVLCSGDTVMRIASISKSITMAAVAKLWEQGKLDLDKPVQEYVPYFPQKNFDGKPVTITCRHLVSHLGGIRHYAKQSNDQKSDLKNGEEKSSTKKEVQKNEFEHKEYYIKENYKDVRSSVDIFKDDPLLAKPGSKFIYSTHAWTLISAIVEAAAKEQFRVHMTKLFKQLGMKNTYIDDNDVLIYHRSRNYIKAKNGYLINAPYVNNSYKLAGGGFLSTVGDLLHFGNAMLYSLQFKMTTQKVSDSNFIETSACNQSTNDKNTDCLNDIMSRKKQILPGYLNSKTVEAMWSPIADFKESKYGMGWAVFPGSQDCQYCEENKYCVYHSGGAIGASSILLILPKECHNEEHIDIEFSGVPKGIVVSILTNLQSINLYKTALTIANIFDHQQLTMHNNQ